MEARRDLVQEKSQRQKVAMQRIHCINIFLDRGLRWHSSRIYPPFETQKWYFIYLGVTFFELIWRFFLYVFTRKKAAQQTYERTSILNDLRELNLELSSVRTEKNERNKICAAKVAGKDCPVCQSEYEEGNATLVCFKTCGHCLCFTWLDW